MLHQPVEDDINCYVALWKAKLCLHFTDINDVCQAKDLSDSILFVLRYKKDFYECCDYANEDGPTYLRRFKQVIKIRKAAIITTLSRPLQAKQIAKDYRKQLELALKLVQRL